MSEQIDRSQAGSVVENGLQPDIKKILPNLHVMGFGELLDTTFSLYRSHFRSFLGISSGYFIAVLVGILMLFLDDSASRTEKIAIWIPTVGVIFGVCVFVVSGLVSAGAQAYLVRTVKVGAALKQGIYRFFPCFVSAFLFGLLAMLLVVVLSVLFEALYEFVVGDGSWVLIDNELLVVIIIWVAGWFVTYWCIFASTILVEGTSGRAGLRRSRDLIRGTWWRVTGKIYGIFLFSVAISFIFRATFGFLLALTELASEEFMGILLMGLWDIPVTRHGLSFSNSLMYIICLGADTFAMPIWVIGGTLLYFNQRIRKEGFDIEMMATRQGE